MQECRSKERTRGRKRGVCAVLVLGVLFFPALSFAATATYASSKVMGPTNGLVGYWTMNAPDINWTTNTILDRSGQGNNGILTNMATKTAPTIGKIGQGMRFIGATTDRINVGSAASLTDLTALTVSFWVRPHSIWGYSTMISKGSWQGSGWALVLKGSDSHIAFLREFSGTDGMWESGGTPTFKKDAWMHVTLTYNKSSVSNTPLIYVNGSRVTLATTSTPTGTTMSDGLYDLIVGADNSGVVGSFPGSLDDVRIYNRILTPTEIKQVYGAGQVKLAATPVKNASGLVGWWTFDGAALSATTAYDKSGYGNNGTLTGTTKPKATTGKLGQALRLSGGNQSSEAVPSASLNDISQLTIAAWVKPTSFSGFPLLLHKRGLSSSGWDLALNSSRVQFENVFTGTDGSWSGPTLRLNTWQHIVVTYSHSSASNIPTFYINGASTTTSPISQPTGTYVSDAATHLRIGGDALTDGLNGSLDDVRVYNRILTPSEVARLYKEGQVTLTSFTCGVSTVKDVDGNVYNTVKIGTQCWMKQNMRVGTRINGSTNQTNNSIIEKYCYDDTASNCIGNNPNQPDGGLYQWNEAMQYSTTPGARGICPAGWHIPTHDEFTTLERAVCTSGSCATDFPYDTTTTAPRGTDEGTKLKANGTSGFEGNFAGYSDSGSFNLRGTNGIFWSSVESGGNAWYRYLHPGSAQIARWTNDKSLGWSVRCLKNL